MEGLKGMRPEDLSNEQLFGTRGFVVIYLMSNSGSVKWIRDSWSEGVGGLYVGYSAALLQNLPSNIISFSTFVSPHYSSPYSHFLGEFCKPENIVSV